MNFISGNVNSVMRIILFILVILLIIFMLPVTIGGILFIFIGKFIINKLKKINFNRHKSRNINNKNQSEFCSNRVIDVEYKEV